MGMRINPKWEDKVRDEIEAYVAGRTTHFEQTTSCTPAAQLVIGLLAKKGIAFKVVQLGSGVKRVTTDVAICPKCNGTGKC
jgi:hypothetical protein